MSESSNFKGSKIVEIYGESNTRKKSMC